MNMVTKCYNCGLPAFHGAAGYAGPQCRCGFQYKSNYDHNALADLLKERDKLRKQLDEARELLKRAVLYIPSAVPMAGDVYELVERNKG